MHKFWHKKKEEEKEAEVNPREIFTFAGWTKWLRWSSIPQPRLYTNLFKNTRDFGVCTILPRSRSVGRFCCLRTSGKKSMHWKEGGTESVRWRGRVGGRDGGVFPRVPISLLVVPPSLPPLSLFFLRPLAACNPNFALSFRGCSVSQSQRDSFTESASEATSDKRRARCASEVVLDQVSRRWQMNWRLMV